MIAIAWPLIKTFWKPIAVVLLVIGIYVFGYAKGDAHRDRIWQAKIESERRSQSIITNAAEAAAIRDLEELRTQLEESNAKLKQLALEAGADPDAARRCLGIDSLRRINRNRKTRP